MKETRPTVVEPAESTKAKATKVVNADPEAHTPRDQGSEGFRRCAIIKALRAETSAGLAMQASRARNGKRD